MKLYGDQIIIRLTGSLVAAGFLAMGLYGIFGAAADLPELNRDRAFWFGVTCIIAAGFAFALSWLIKDVRGVWCAPPRRNIFED